MTQALVPVRTNPPRVLQAGATKADIRLAKMQARAEHDARVMELALQWSRIAERVLIQPIPLAIGGVLATNLLSQLQTGTYNGQPTWAITGAQAVTLQTAIVAPALLTTLADATKPALDIASLIKLISAM